MKLSEMTREQLLAKRAEIDKLLDKMDAESAPPGAPCVVVHRMGDEVLLQFYREDEDDGVWLQQSSDDRELFTGMSFDGEEHVLNMPANDESHPLLFDIQLVGIKSESNVETKAAAWYVTHKDEIEKLFPIRPSEES